MEHTLFVDGKKFITAREASLLFGYEPDYVGQLIRSGKLDGKLMGRSWFLDPEELKQYMKNRSREARGRKRGSKAPKKQDKAGRNIKAKLHLKKADFHGEPNLPGEDIDASTLAVWWPMFLKNVAQNISSSLRSDTSEISAVPMTARLADDLPSTTRLPSHQNFATSSIRPSALSSAPVANKTNVMSTAAPADGSVNSMAGETEKPREFTYSPQTPTFDSNTSSTVSASTQFKNTAQDIPSSSYSEKSDDMYIRADHSLTERDTASVRVPITYHPDATPLIPPITRRMRSDIAPTRLTSAYVQPLATPITLAAAKALGAHHSSYMRSVGRLLAAVFALSALVFAVLSGFMSGDYAVTANATQVASPLGPGTETFFEHLARNIYLAISSF